MKVETAQVRMEFVVAKDPRTSKFECLLPVGQVRLGALYCISALLEGVGQAAGAGQNAPFSGGLQAPEAAPLVGHMASVFLQVGSRKVCVFKSYMVQGGLLSAHWQAEDNK